MELGAIEGTHGLTRGFCELTLETRNPAAIADSVRPGQLDELSAELRRRGVPHEGAVEHDGGDRSLYFEDPEGNVVEAWDFFERGDGARQGVDALG